MRALLWLLLLFALAIGFTLAGQFNPGYAILVYPPYRIELSLTLFILLLVAAMLVLQWIGRAATATFSLPALARRWREERRQQAGRTALHAAIEADLDGHPAQTETLARRAYEAGFAPHLAARLAARAAGQQGAANRRDEWLKKAAGPLPDPTGHPSGAEPGRPPA